MSRIALTGGAYQARSLIASAQRCVNLYPEAMPPGQGEPAPMTYYPTPGLRIVKQAAAGSWRCLYQSSLGAVYGVLGGTVYAIAQNWTLTELGTIPDLTTPVRMQDNGLVLVIVDGGGSGWYVTLADNTFAQITDSVFTGSINIAVLDTFLLFNQPRTGLFYLSPSEYAGNSTAFDGNYIAAKATYPDLLVGAANVGQQVWLIGKQTTEIWVDSGAADFPFQRYAGPLIPHGCGAPYSIVTIDGAVFWLSSGLDGNCIVLRGSGVEADRVSTHAIETIWQRYPTTADAIGLTYQEGGHSFYVLIFPSADATWVYDEATQLWHERAWMDDNGVLHRHRMFSCCNAYGTILAGDWQNGALYALDPDVFDDAGQPIQRIRSFPHIMNDGKRVMHRQFVADMAVGAGDLDVSLRMSDTRGATFGSPLVCPTIPTGAYDAMPQWWRLGMARDRVFELSWSSPVSTALNGAFLVVEQAAS
jgi:hypothetical protein